MGGLTDEQVLFLSTSSARRTTIGEERLFRALTDFYPRPPRGGRRRVYITTLGMSRISIHVLREEDDPQMQRSVRCLRNFYPRPPRGGRPREQMPLWMPARISIHVLREEDDCYAITDERGGLVFLSTSSARRTTAVDA